MLEASRAGRGGVYLHVAVLRSHERYFNPDIFYLDAAFYWKCLQFTLVTQAIKVMIWSAPSAYMSSHKRSSDLPDMRCPTTHAACSRSSRTISSHSLATDEEEQGKAPAMERLHLYYMVPAYGHLTSGFAQLIRTLHANPKLKIVVSQHVLIRP
ncbi:hypothetical protein MRB53_037603 [Persea americana]|nr:hypothetical protein MRB53_037603 [Persea americana]